MVRASILPLPFAALAILSFAACNDGTSSVSLLLTDSLEPAPVRLDELPAGLPDDAPTDRPDDTRASPGAETVTSAVVTIDQVYLESEENGTVVLTKTPAVIDLFALSDHSLDLLGDVTIPSGSYDGLRFVISGGYLVVEDEDGVETLYATEGYNGTPGEPDGALQTPSYGSSGLKVLLPPDAITFDDERTILIIAFDVNESFGHVSGGSDQWTMHPVIHGTAL